MSIIDTIKTTLIKANEKKPLHHGEIFEIWAHLVSRYDVLKKTQILSTYAHDPDLQIFLEKGINTLQNQINQLEKICMEYSIPLPDRPSIDVTHSSPNNPLWTDKMIYRDILNGMSQFLDTHVRTFKFMWNDDLRPIFVEFIKRELDFYDDWMKYGKLKGWLNTPPMPVTTGD